LWAFDGLHGITPSLDATPTRRTQRRQAFFLGAF
jgi:hypothetical protein